MMKRPTSQRSWRQSLAQGAASAASGTLGRVVFPVRARFSGRKILSPAKAGSGIIPSTKPRAARRFTSLRFACPGLNSAAGYAGLSLVLLSLTVACGRKEATKKAEVTNQPPSTTQDYPNLTAQARLLEDALGRKDYGKVIDLTYPKVIEFAGGREKMLTETTREVESMEAEGVKILSSSCGTPSQFVSDAGGIYAVIPVVSKVKATDGVFQTEGSLIGISTDGGQNWTFVDATGKDQTELKKILPNLDKFNLPPEKAPVKLATN
jgi:hypothetical protein